VVFSRKTWSSRKEIYNWFFALQWLWVSYFFQVLQKLLVSYLIPILFWDHPPLYSAFTLLWPKFSYHKYRYDTTYQIRLDSLSAKPFSFGFNVFQISLSSESYLQLYNIYRSLFKKALVFKIFLINYSDSYGFLANVRFTFKCLIIKRPGITVFALLSLTTLVLAYQVRIFEIVYYRSLNLIDFDSYF
jgi:hypothetical protein